VNRDRTRRESLSAILGVIDFLDGMIKITRWKVSMKSFFKTLLSVLIISSAFIIGFHLGKEKEKKKIPEFQED